MYLKGNGGTTVGDSHLTCATDGWPRASDERLLERLGYSVCRRVVASRSEVRRGVQVRFMCICPVVVLDVLHSDLAGYGSTGHWLSAIAEKRSSDPLWRQAPAQPSFLTLTRIVPLIVDWPSSCHVRHKSLERGLGEHSAAKRRCSEDTHQQFSAVTVNSHPLRRHHTSPRILLRHPSI